MNLSDLVAASRQFVDELDQYREPWESHTHWYARKTFLRHNWDRFDDKPRLLCLSSAWANVEFMGNRYPHAVMNQLKEMTSEMETSSDLLREAEKQMSQQGNTRL
uniref:XRN2-binding (XTBD) domain-containing protein n=1 Tax=Ciona savignyi TaxID=51511 RepID=H2YMP0_CIOSA